MKSTTLLIAVGLVALLEPCFGQNGGWTEYFTSGITGGIFEATWTVYNQQQGQMTAIKANDHLSFIAPTSTVGEQNAMAVFNNGLTVSNDWTVDITGHNSSGWSTNGSSQLQLWVVNSKDSGTGYRISMACGAENRVDAKSSSGALRQTFPAIGTNFGLRLVHRGGIAGNIEAWFDQSGRGASWRILDTISLSSFWPDVVENDIIKVGIVSDTYYGPVNEGDILADNFRLTNGAISMPPVITVPPMGRLVFDTNSYTFRVAATGVQPMGYMWYFNRTNLVQSGTNSALKLLNISMNNVGTYHVVVTNIFGSVTSAMATLTLALPPSITSQPASQAAKLGSSAVFSVTATTGPEPFGYMWYFNGTKLVQSGTNNVLMLPEVSTSSLGTYTVVVTNLFGRVTSESASLTYTSPDKPFIDNGQRLGFSTNRFGFDVYGTNGQTIVVDGSANLRDWVPLYTNKAASGSIYFCDPASTTQAHRFYRARPQ